MIFNLDDPPPELEAELPEQLTREDWIAKLIDFLLGLYLSSQLSAKDFCIACYYMTQAGWEQAAPYALSPDSQSGKFQDKLDTALDFTKDNTSYYPVLAPMKNAHTGERETGTVLMGLPHEMIDRELNEKPQLVEQFAETVSQAEWLPIWESNPIIVRSSASERLRYLPLALYMDAARHGVREELLVFTCRNLCSHKRHLVFGIQKSLLCDCGCSGWCTLYVCFATVAWSLLCLVEGRNPCTRHDTKPLDERRAQMAGHALRMKGVCIDINGDWAEFGHRWGFAPWNARMPCFMCWATREQMRDAQHRIVLKTFEDYDRQCQTWEVWVSVSTVAVHSKIKLALLDNAKMKGLVLRCDILETTPPLLRGDRLEPCVLIPDVHEFPFLKPPFTCLFWRVPKKHEPYWCSRRNPIVSISLGISIFTFSGDVLHCFHLGLFPVYMTFALHKLFDIDAFESRATRGEDFMIHNALTLRSWSQEWYKSYYKALSEQAKPGFTKVSSITVGLLGEKDMSSVVGFKAAECRHFLPFVLHLLQKFKTRLAAVVDFDALYTAGAKLLEFTDICNANPRKLPPGLADYLVTCVDDHCKLAFSVGVKRLPKHHMAL